MVSGGSLPLADLILRSVLLRASRRMAAWTVVACGHPSRRIAEPVIGRAFARPVGDAPQDEVGNGIDMMDTMETPY
jgi:hypothetical protein